MSVDLSLILPNDCHDLRDNAQALETFNKTILRIQEYFSGHEGFVEDIVIYNSDAPDWSEFYNPDEDAGDIALHYRLSMQHATFSKGIGIYGLIVVIFIIFGLMQKILMELLSYGHDKMLLI